MFKRPLFSKRLYVTEKTTYQTTDYFTVINPDEIAALPAPPFSQSHYGAESDYKTYLERVQPLIEEYKRTGNVSRPALNFLYDIEKNREQIRFIDNFKISFLDCSQYINVGKTADGKYKVVSNGRHRMYIAKKYNLRLLVHVTQEEVLYD